MFTQQCPRGIPSAQVLDQVNVEENPVPAELGARDRTGFGAGGQGGGVELQKGRGVLEGEGAHCDDDCRRGREVGETGWGGAWRIRPQQAPTLRLTANGSRIARLPSHGGDLKSWTGRTEWIYSRKSHR